MEKFFNPQTTAKGEPRASVTLKQLNTLWFNTGTRCNLSCENCYIESNPKNDRLSFLEPTDVTQYLDEIHELKLPTTEIGFTGGEPFLNPKMIELLQVSLERGFETIVLTNAYRLNRVKDELRNLARDFKEKFTVRVSLDHYSKEVHEMERGVDTFEPTLENMKWLSKAGVRLAVAGRSLTDENVADCRQKYQDLFEARNIKIDLQDPNSLVVFPEMDPQKEVPEITTSCWGLLNKSPDDMMCASSRMIVKRKGETKPKVLACTLLAYDPQFEMGETLAEAKKTVALNHKFCAQFCVLGGASCS